MRVRPPHLLLIVPLLCAACASSPWDDYQSSLYDSLDVGTKEARNDHAALLTKLVVASEAAGGRPPPGVCAELAFYRSRLGEAGEVDRLLALEEQHYPEAKRFLDAMRRVLVGPEPEDEEEGEEEEEGENEEEKPSEGNGNEGS